jgi:hypothetical protein
VIQEVFRRWKRLLHSCTKHCRQAGIEVSLELRVEFSNDMSSDMAATMERLEEYRTHNAQFCKRLYEYSCIMFTAQVRLNSFSPQFSCLRFHF